MGRIFFFKWNLKTVNIESREQQTQILTAFSLLSPVTLKILKFDVRRSVIIREEKSSGFLATKEDQKAKQMLFAISKVFLLPSTALT